MVSSLKQAYFHLPPGDGSVPPAISSIAAETPYISERILAARNHTALLGWYINDELDQSFLPQIRTHYELFKTLDPECVQLWATPLLLRSLLLACSC